MEQSNTLVAVGALIGTILAVVLAFLKRQASASDRTKIEQAERVVDSTLLALLLAARQVAPLTPTRADDDAVAFLEALRSAAHSHGVKVSEAQQQRALEVFRALRAQSLQARPAQHEGAQ